MQSRDRLLTPLLKYFALALAHGILIDIWEKNSDIIIYDAVVFKP